MILNGTFFIQILNFLIAYYIIDKLFLKPAVSFIQAENAYKSNLENQIKSEEIFLGQLKKEKENEFQDFRIHAKQLMPSKKLEKVVTHITVPSPGKIEIQEDLIKNIKSIIMNRLKNVN